MSIWYYCKGYKLAQFIRQGFIPSDDINRNVGKNVSSAVVCSIDPGGDQLENGRVLEYGEWRELDTDEMAGNFGGLFRLELSEDSAPLTWNDWVEQSGISRKEARELYRFVGLDKTSREKLRFSFNPIPSKSLLSISIWKNGGWEKWQGNIGEGELSAFGIVLDEVIRQK